LKAGLSGGGSGDAMSGINPIAPIDFARTWQIWEPLVAFGISNNLEMVLAEEITPNSDASVWTIRLRSGVTWHDGKNLTADDVVYTLQSIVSKPNLTGGTAGLSAMNAAGIKKLDSLTVQVPMKTPCSTFSETLANYYYQVIQDGSPLGASGSNGYINDVIPHPVGTGPFKYQSFQPGVQSTFVRNENYWQSGLPYVDELVINDILDETSQVNALLAGEVHAIDLLSATSAEALIRGGAGVVVGSGGFVPFTMRVDQPPFNDVRVRQAMRLVVNRPEMLSVVFGDYGNSKLGNDYPDIYDPDYNHSLPQRVQDIDQAKFLLKQAGHENLTVTLQTAPIAQGAVQSAEVIKQQAQAAGITINIQELTYTDFYGSQFLSWDFAQDISFYSNYLFICNEFKIGAQSPFNETHFNDPQFNSLYNQAQGTVDPVKRREIIHEMQDIEYTRGAEVIACYPPIIDGISNKLRGVRASTTGLSLGTFDFKSMWLD
jgi:peptide/nickel transport system substrate-binding protein